MTELDVQMYTASVIADSISEAGDRITTIRVVYPHAVHKDMLRHRCMNRNVESFRAQKPEDLLANLKNGHAFTPDVFARRTKGMGQGITLEIEQAGEAAFLWRRHLNHAISTAERLLELDVAKQQINFPLQDFCPLTEIITATDWSNFYALRCELKPDGTPMARPEVYKTACAIRDAIAGSESVLLPDDHLHLPFLTDEDHREISHRRAYYAGDYWEVEGYWVYVSAGRCARISYGADWDWRLEKREVSYARAETLLKNGHFSPFEQQAKPFSRARWNGVLAAQHEIRMRESIAAIERDEMCRQLEYSGNLHGWVSARKTFKNEYDYSKFKRTDG